MTRRYVAAALGSIILLSVALLTSRGADTLPSQIPDAEFWRMVNEFSEPDGFFQFENFVSNEPTYQVILPQVAQMSWSYLTSEDNYRFVREMQQKNLIVPLVGDFGGPKAIKAVGAYLKSHGAMTRLFYISNVEDYLQPTWASYLSNLAALPQDDTTLLIRFDPNMDKPVTSLRLMKDSPKDWPGRSWR